MAWTEDDLADHYNRLKVRHFGEPDGLPETQPKELRESLIQAECIRFLAEDGWRALRTDPVSDRGRGTGFGELGMADYQVMRPAASETERQNGWCQMAWIEFKCGRNKARKDQQAWHTKERARGFMTWIANEDFPATVDGFREFYRTSGLMRRSKWW